MRLCGFREVELFFSLSTVVVAAILFVVIFGSTVGGSALGRSRWRDKAGLRESSAALQGALLGFMGLILAFGLSLALGRHDARRVAIVDDANAIGTTYLRAQTLAEPYRSQSMELLTDYTDVQLQMTHEIPGSEAAQRSIAEGSALHRQLWAINGQAVLADPTGSATRLYEQSLNAMIDQQTVRVAGLNNRVPTEVLLLQVLGSAIAMFLLGLHVGVLGRSLAPLLLAAGLVTSLLFVTFDLDRPTRGFITMPDTPLAALRESMNDPPAAGPTR